MCVSVWCVCCVCLHLLHVTQGCIPVHPRARRGMCVLYVLLVVVYVLSC